MKYVARTYAVVLFFVGLFLCLSLAAPVYSQSTGVNSGETLQTNPKLRSNTVSGQVVDNLPPTIPVLIAPANSSYVTVSRPTFQWLASTDDRAISHYKLFLNGQVVFDNISPSATNNDSLPYTITKVGDQYSLTPRNNLTDSQYTWKIQAVDTNANSRDSATWSFVLDTTSPPFVITDIGEVSTSISVQDPSTVPDEPIHIETNEPVLKGTTEANSSIQITVAVTDGTTQQYSTTADSQGQWQFTLPILPRDTVITLSFQITDPAGHIVILSDIQFIIDQQYLFPTSTPIPTTPGTTPDPTITNPPSTIPPTTDQGTPEIPLTPSLAIPTFTPKEIAQQIVNIVIPEAIRDLIPESVKQTTRRVAPVGSALLASALPLTTTLAFASQFGWNISLEILVRILQALGLLPRPKPQGIVFDSRSGKPVPFAILNIQKIGDVSLIETLVTTVDGIYGGVSLSPGKYRIEVRHQDFIFPSRKPRPAYLTQYEYYLGEVFESSRESAEQLYMIPVDNKNPDELENKNLFSWRFITSRISRLFDWATVPMMFFSGFMLIYYPTIVNWIVFLLYLAMSGYKLFKWLKIPNIHGKVVDAQGTQIKNVFVRIITENTNQLAALLVTDHRGQFKGFVPKDKYQVSLTKQGYMWMENNTPVNFYSVDVKEKRALVTAIMESTDKLYQDLFS